MSGFERRKIPLGRLHPGHRPARHISPFTHGLAARFVGQKTGDLAAQGTGIAKRDQNAAPIAQQLLGVPIWCRDHCLSQSKAIGKRPRRHLGLVEIGRHVDVAHRDEVQKRGLIDELVEEHHVVPDTERLHPGGQAVAISLAVISHEVRMSRAENDIDGIWARFYDARHGVEHHLDALVG